MARVTIVEVLDARGAVRSRTRLDAFPATIGRAYSADVILDDPYVCPRHARVVLTESGDLVAEDAGSVNGVSEHGAPVQRGAQPARVASVLLRPGAEIRVGRTVLRFCDPDQPVAPALPDTASDVVGDGAIRIMPARHPITALPPRAALLVCVATLGVFALNAFLGSYTRVTEAKVVSEALLILAGLAIWASGWAVASRIVSHRSSFIHHLALACSAAVVALALGLASQWLSFFFPASAVHDVLPVLGGLALATAALAGHLALASPMPHRRRWRAALAVTGTVVALIALAAYADRDESTTAMSYPSSLKPLGPRWLQTMPVAEFTRRASDLRAQVDSLAAEEQ
ncbi:MAG: FHA domain-containing protein [Gemmatimonadaceae bacterium]